MDFLCNKPPRPSGRRVDCAAGTSVAHAYTDAHSPMFHVVMPYGLHGDFKKATRVASVPTAEAAWGYLDDVRIRLASLNVPLDLIELVVVDEGREPVARPNQKTQ